jgi:hypothetical protein
MPNPVYPEASLPVELSPENVALATEIIRGLRRQRPHDPQAMSMTVNQLVRMQLVDLRSRLQTVVPDYFPAKRPMPVVDREEGDEEGGEAQDTSGAPPQKRKYTRHTP